MKLFGKDLFNFKPQKDEYMYDFAQHGLLNNDRAIPAWDLMAATQGVLTPAGKKKPKKEKKKVYITPKGVFEMKSLNAHDFRINADKSYIDEQVKEIKLKLDLMPKQKKPREGDLIWNGVGFGRLELESIMERLKNRSRINEFSDMLEKYPHTTSDLINEVVQGDTNLRCQKADEFVPDFPTEAVKAMKEYNKMCMELTGKKAVFYVVAESSDFEKKNKRRDPILIAQSPFGFFWQILGAWDKEMKYLADL